MLAPFHVMYEAELPAYSLPQELARVYGQLGFADRVVYSNFVTSVDGVASLGSVASAGSVLSGKNAADRFLMALLRACADAVLIGAGTLRATPGHLWTPDHVFPDLAVEFTALRTALGRSPEPRLVVMTASGELDRAHPALKKGAVILTTDAVAKRIGPRLPRTCEVIGLGKGKTVNIKRALGELRKMWFDVVLSEAGPHLMGELVKANVLDEIFLTLSPVLAGRDKERRFGMLEGVELLPSLPAWIRLLSARRHNGHVFLRYSLSPQGRGLE